jgi:hypothetical protein
MKRILALLIAVVMTFSVVAVPVSAITVEDVEKFESTATDVFAFIEDLMVSIHALVGGILGVFDEACPFCGDVHVSAPVEDETPVDPENPDEPEVPEEPEEIVGVITNICEFAEALKVGGTYTVEADLVLESAEIPEGIKLNLDLKGNTVSGAAIVNKGELAISNGKVQSAVAGLVNNGKATLTDIDMTAGDAGNYAAICNAGSYTEFNNVNIVSAGGGIGVNGGEAVFNGGSIAVNSTSTSGRYVFYVVGEGAKLDINDGTFSFSKKLNQKRAYIYTGAGATVAVNGGTFGTASTKSGYTAGILGDGAVAIKGAAFGFNPTKWVAEGYEAVKDGSVWTVSAVA